MNILKHIQKLLDQTSKMSTYQEPSADVPYERLLVDCVDENEDTADILEITAHQQNLTGPFIISHQADTYYLIQFQFVMPLEVPAENFNQVSSCLHFFNRLLHCPGFELDEVSDRVIYRYAWFIKQSAINLDLIKIVLENIQLCFKMFNPYVKDIAAGKYALEDILKQVIELSKMKSFPLNGA